MSGLKLRLVSYAEEGNQSTSQEHNEIKAQSKKVSTFAQIILLQ